MKIDAQVIPIFVAAVILKSNGLTSTAVDEYAVGRIYPPSLTRAVFSGELCWAETPCDD